MNNNRNMSNLQRIISYFSVKIQQKRVHGATGVITRSDVIIVLPSFDNICTHNYSEACPDQMYAKFDRSAESSFRDIGFVSLLLE